ncbi:MAG: type I DNA topoisomerase [Firmicutes bacterium]|nr:type I DNA topoisomerase [Bacillota bacterium]
MKLVIIEGIGKKETIEKYLGKGYKVFATKGHVRDLPSGTMAVDVKDNFKPRYEVIAEKKDVVKKMLGEAAHAEEVLLATDPDREGEAISWHVATLLKIPEDKKARIVFNEISKKAVSTALENPRPINLDLVDAQQARRVLDRLVGYKVSPLLCKRIQNKLSAGRVQSVTLRLIVDRDREIAAFKPEEYWNFWSVLEKFEDKKEIKPFKAALVTKGGKKIKLGSANDVEGVKKELNGGKYTVTGVKREVTLARPPAPFITSSMQQDAMNKLGMSLKQSAANAQSLYEGVDLPNEGKVALVTYIRTDSTRVADDAMHEARAFIGEKFGGKFIPNKPNIYASKKGAQDAHEAVRPISVHRTPESLKGVIADGLYKLYKLIYDRFLASQMSPAEYDSLTVDISCGYYGFKVTGKSLIFAGFTAVYHSFEEEKEEEGGIAGLPIMAEGDLLHFIEYKTEQKFTKPPSHYTEASLIKTMEEKGIGRPATYTPTITLIVSREYVEKDGKFLKATQLGMQATDYLIKYFPDIMDIKFTADMESKLDKIEDGGEVWQNMVSDFYIGLDEKVRAAFGDKEPDEESEFVCCKCGAKMVYRSGRFGRFLACSGFPKCRYTQQIDEGGHPTEVKVKESDVVCELCGAKMVFKNGKYGEFLACPSYPKCKNIKNTDGGERVKGQGSGAEGRTDVGRDTSARRKEEGNGDGVAAGEGLPPCPICGKPMVKRHARSIFYGCSGYPNCKFTSSARPVMEKCPDCDGYMVLRNRRDGMYHVCGKSCGYKIKVGELENVENVREAEDTAS